MRDKNDYSGRIGDINLDGWLSSHEMGRRMNELREERRLNEVDLDRQLLLFAVTAIALFAVFMAVITAAIFG